MFVWLHLIIMWMFHCPLVTAGGNCSVSYSFYFHRNELDFFCKLNLRGAHEATRVPECLVFDM